MEATDKELIIHPDNLRAFILKCLQSVGTPKQQAEDLTELLVSADQRGHYSHGVNRLGKLLNKWI